jgi:hypothetical protein
MFYDFFKTTMFILRHMAELPVNGLIGIHYWDRVTRLMQVFQIHDRHEWGGGAAYRVLDVHKMDNLANKGEGGGYAHQTY